ncbi:hypothetical protein C4564_02800 [Candidatus Microgenomates bacterium]|nr:MAG: hypothetical protein C4564_02800 [Candidatus Microgenomates bacterium]
MSKVGTLLSSLPSELVDNLVEEFGELHKNYFLGRWDASQLNGGRFGEACLRILEYKNSGGYTPIGTTLPRRQVVTQIAQNMAIEDSLRLYIPSLVETIMDFRNNRNVAHLSQIMVNEMDATLVIQAANWVMAELIRTGAQISPDDARDEIKKIIERKVPLLEEIGGRLKVLDPKLSTKQKILVISYQKYPRPISESDLLDWTEYSIHNSGRFRKSLKELNSDALIDYRNEQVVLTNRGLRYVEKNINFELEI